MKWQMKMLLPEVIIIQKKIQWHGRIQSIIPWNDIKMKLYTKLISHINKKKPEISLVKGLNWD